MSQEELRLINLLNEKHQWPTLFAFKFIVPADKGNELLALVPESEKTETRPSSGNKYMAYTFHCPVGSARDVLDIYARVKGIKGLISL